MQSFKSAKECLTDEFEMFFLLTFNVYESRIIHGKPQLLDVLTHQQNMYFP